jgi:TonB family protein
MELNTEVNKTSKHKTPHSKNVVLFDNQGMAIRFFHWNGEPSTIIRRKDNRRLELVSNLDFFRAENIDFIEIGRVTDSSFYDSQKKKVNRLEVTGHGYLSLVDRVENHLVNESLSGDKKNTWYTTLIAVFIFFSTGTYLMQFAPKTSANIEKDLQQTVVKIVKNIHKTVPVANVQVLKTEQVKTENQITKVSPTKIAGLKRMGALATLGSLSTGKNKGGLDISAAQSSAGPGMGGGTEGSGGMQTSLYAKGITSAALGAGNNVNGAGGYGTKGKGGGQAGYGKMALTGATGARTTQLGNEASVATGLDRDQIAAVINRNQGQITFCYEQGLKDTPGISGRVAIDFTISGNGSVSAAQVDSTSLNSKAVEDCMVMRLKTWKFPVPEGGVDVRVKYPFKLERAG